MPWKNTAFSNFRLYAVTDLQRGGPDELRKIEAAYLGGADVVQLRSKSISDAALLTAGHKIRKIATRLRKLFFVNDRVDIALLLEADGVHLGQNDMPIADARKLARRAGVGLWIGRSTHNIRQALEAERQGADYIGTGPVFPTPTKPGKSAVGLELIAQAACQIKIPFVAIGGINLRNVGRVIQAGASRIAVVRAIFEADNPVIAARKLKKIMER